MLHEINYIFKRKFKIGIMNKRILIFPAGMPRSLEYLDRALHIGLEVIGASSLGFDPSRLQYQEWTYLPYITDPEFNNALKQVTEEHSVSEIYTPNIVVWDYLNREMKKFAPDIVLINESPVDSELAPYRKAVQLSKTITKNPLILSSPLMPHPPQTDIEIASMLHHAESIPGMCDHEKICALYEISRHCPHGDIVEIGSWWGKSSFVLAQLACWYEIGNLLCIDPWSNQYLVQDDEKGLLNKLPIDADEAFTVFQINLLPYSNGRVNFFRMPSVEASKCYCSHTLVKTRAFGETSYTGRIALLHIDGNHGYEAVKADIESWGKYVVNGGWIVFDDYIWPFGDGPKRVGDAYLVAHHDRITAAFVMGSALFLQVSSQRA